MARSQSFGRNAWLDAISARGRMARFPPKSSRVREPDSKLDQSSPELKLAFEKFMQKYASSSGQKTLSPKERELLFAKFMKFVAQSKEQAAAR